MTLFSVSFYILFQLLKQYPTVNLVFPKNSELTPSNNTLQCFIPIFINEVVLNDIELMPMHTSTPSCISVTGLALCSCGSLLYCVRPSMRMSAYSLAILKLTDYQSTMIMYAMIYQAIKLIHSRLVVAQQEQWLCMISLVSNFFFPIISSQQKNRGTNRKVHRRFEAWRNRYSSKLVIH